MRNNGSLLLFLSIVTLCSACRPKMEREEQMLIDSLNERAYRLRYVDIDSVEALAQKALSLSVPPTRSHIYPDGRDEAHNNLAFVEYQQMNFDGVDSILNLVYTESHTPLQLLCADVMQMKTFQRTGDGARFFRAKSNAEKRLQRISKREGRMSQRERALWVYAQTEFHIITATYEFYQEQDSLARAELEKVPPCMQQHVDTAQWVYYNYMLGPGGLVEGHDAAAVTLREFDYLFRAYSISRREGYRYFEANSLQAFATMLLANDSLIAAARSDEYQLLRFQHAAWMAETESFPLALGQHALHLFQDYDDLFQAACAYRTLGEIYFQQGDNDRSLQSYASALHCVNRHHLRYYGHISPDTLSAFNPHAVHRSVEQEWIEDPRISTVPEWISGIRQQLSLTYSALGMKQESDYNRNFYLDLLQATNQNQELESHTAELKRQTRSLRGRMVLCIVLLVVALLLALLLRRRLRRRAGNMLRELEDNRWQPYRDFVAWNTAQLSALEEEREERGEQLQANLLRVAADKRKNAENRAKVSLVHGIVPFLDRIGGEVMRMKQEGTVSPERREYVMELVDEIERHNAILTEWIRMEQGQLGLHVSTVALQGIFDIVAEGHYAFDQKGVKLRVMPTEALVKADESLTLFMVNTLCDNARKFTPEGGVVTLSAEVAEEYVEVRVEDTGCGLSEADVQTLTHSKVYDAAKIGRNTDGKGFGFGLMNCRGIIEKYKKTSAIFSCCDFGVRSKEGEGSTFYFRLPHVLRMLLLLFFALQPILAPTHCRAADVTELYDSLFQANVEGHYEDAVRVAAEAIEALNATHRALPPMVVADTLFQYDPAEVQWAKAGATADYELIVGLRNELALAALALGDWTLYHYNNRACIRLHKYLHQDKTLPTYFRRLERTHRNSNILLLVIIVMSAFILFFAVRLLVGLQLYKQREIDALKHYLQHVFAYARTQPRPETFMAETQQYPEMQQQARHYREWVREVCVQPQCRLRDDISQLSDDAARMEFEQRRLYVQNQILDNCLSTIKHESMFYPSRIRLLAGKMQAGDIGQLSELVRYYRHIYSLLCRQADEQVSQPGFKRQRVSVGDVLQRAALAARRQARQKGISCNVESLAESPLNVLADEMLLDELMEALLSGMLHAEAQLFISASEQERFVRFTLRDATVTPTPAKLSNLFFPHAAHIPYLVAKQILREHDTYTNHPGCRLVAQQSAAGGYEIYFTLPKDNG